MKKVCYNVTMQIEWKSIENKEYEIINSWLSSLDKHNLCMTEKNWKQTAHDIQDCLKIMDNAQFKNIIGYVNGKPVVAVMFGIEQIKVLNLYNIVVNPKFRNRGIAKGVICQLLKKDKTLKLTQPYNKVIASTLPDNVKVQQMFKDLSFQNLGFDGEYVVYEKNIFKTDEKIM